MSEAFEEEVKAAVAPGPDRAMSGVQFMAANRDGIIYEKCFGNLSIEPDSPPMEHDSIVWFASCTKLLASLCAVQCVERGLFTLDEDASRLIPELGHVKVLRGFSDPESMTKPILEPPTTAITPRMLLTHTSGFGYIFMYPNLLAAAVASGADVKAQGIMEPNFKIPTLFQPGEGWTYGTSIDWAGLLVSRANNGMRLGEYMQKNIFDPLGVTDFTFNLKSRPDLEARAMSTTHRGPDEKLFTGSPFGTTDAAEDLGGGGLFGSGRDYFKVLQAVLREDPNILAKKETWKMIREVQVEPKQPMSINMLYTHYDKTAPQQSVPEGGIRWGHGLVSAICLSNVEGWCRKGTLLWGGMQNNNWWIDHETGLVTWMNTQNMPYEDPAVVKFKGAFQAEMLRRFGGS